MGLRLLMVGSNSVESLEGYYLSHLIKMPGVEIQCCPLHSLFYQYYAKSTLNRILFRSGLSGVFQHLNKLLLNQVEDFKPDVVLVFKGMEIFTSTLLHIKKDFKVKMVNYNPDHPFQFFGKGSGNKNVIDGIPYFDLHISYSKIISESLRREYNVKSAVIPFGYQYLSDDASINSGDFAGLYFMGYPDKERAFLIDLIGKSGIPIDVYGHNWKSFLKETKNIKVFEHKSTNEICTIASKYRVGLNLFRPHNIGSHNMRTFELPASGSIALMPFSQQQIEFFENEKEAFYFNSKEHLIILANELLHLNDQEAKKIKRNTIDRCKNSGYSYKDRAIELLTLIKAL